MIPLPAAAERVRAATAEEWRALLSDLRHERADVVYEIERTQARIGVLEAMLGKLEALSA